jgi:GT2 family glycosyltransferase
MDPAEDIDLSWRIQLAGFKFGTAPEAVVFARHRPTAGTVFRQTFAYGISEVKLYTKFRGSGMPASSTTAAIRRFASLVRHADDLFAGEAARWDWCARAGWRCGRLVGSLRERVLHL